MKTMTVAELKSHLSEVLEQLLQNGEPIAISYGRKRLKVAALVPYSQVVTGSERPLGLMKGRGRCVIHDDFRMSDEELLGA